MLRCIKVLLITTLVLAAASPALAFETWRQEHCRMNKATNVWTPFEVRQTIRCAVEKWGVPGGAAKAIDVALCESGYDLQDAGGDGYAGTFQQSEQYWPSRWRALKPQGWELQRSPTNPRANTVVSIRMAHGAGWSAWAQGACA